MPFCPKCGKDIPLGQEFCEEHAPVEIKLRPFEIAVCSCGRVRTHDRWFTPTNLEASVLKAAKEHCQQRASFRVEELVVPERRGERTTCKLVASYQGKEYPSSCTVRNQRCDKCARMGTEYFTAKVQLRDPPEGVLEYIESFLEPLTSKGVAVNKVEETLRGPDLYLTHKSSARQLGEKLVRRFGGAMKASEQLFSRDKQTSKGLYRLNVVVQFPSFTVGDVVLVESRAVLVTGLGKRCTGRDVEHDRKVVFVPGDEAEVLQQYKTTISMVHPRLEAIHPVTFQSVPVRNHPAMLGAYELGRKVKAVLAGKRLLII
ncbi:hypothetical protein JXA12_05650 [Candidatus Woesearchaeota archaeon]|nr:hypothetical protein [Candidatus Woesearchaeota archaeon]